MRSSCASIPCAGTRRRLPTTPPPAFARGSATSRNERGGQAHRAELRSFHPNSRAAPAAEGHSLRVKAADAGDSKSPALTGFRVRVPASAPPRNGPRRPLLRARAPCARNTIETRYAQRRARSCEERAQARQTFPQTRSPPVATLGASRCHSAIEVAHLRAKGVPVHDVRDILGHASLRTADIYATSRLEDRREAIRRIGTAR